MRKKRIKPASYPSQGIERCPECKALLDYDECYKRATRDEVVWTYWRCRICGTRFKTQVGGVVDILRK